MGEGEGGGGGGRGREGERERERGREGEGEGEFALSMTTDHTYGVTVPLNARILGVNPDGVAPNQNWIGVVSF